MGSATLNVGYSNMERRTMHFLVIGLFAAALIFYAIHLTTTALVFAGIGVVLELAAWSTWINGRRKSRASGSSVKNSGGF